MLDQQDKQFIKEVVTEVQKNTIEAVGLMIEQNINPQLDDMRSDIASIKATMVTKDYLDEKMADLRGDLVVMVRKEDTKLRELVTILKEKSVLQEPDVKRILAMEPFAGTRI